MNTDSLQGIQPTTSLEVSYTLNAQDIIIAVNVGWNKFALQNDADQAAFAEHIIGQPLKKFIRGDQTMMFIFTMINSARVLNRPVYRPYRCDSPQLKRYMEMTIFPKERQEVEIIHRLLYTEPIISKIDFSTLYPDDEFKNEPLSNENRVEAYIRRCSLCNRIEINKTWFEVDHAVNQGFIRAGSKLKVIYGVCRDCSSRRGIYL